MRGDLSFLNFLSLIHPLHIAVLPAILLQNKQADKILLLHPLSFYFPSTFSLILYKSIKKAHPFRLLKQYERDEHISRGSTLIGL